MTNSWWSVPAGYYVTDPWTDTIFYKLLPCENELTEHAHYEAIKQTSPICPWACDDGYGRSDNGKCFPLCPTGATTMNGFNVYADKHTQYAMAVARGTITCWISADKDTNGKLKMEN